MFKESIKSIIIMLKYARKPTIIKILVVLFSSILTPLSLYFTKQLIDNIEPYVAGESDIFFILIWGILLLISMLFSATKGYYDRIIEINLRSALMKKFTPVILNKFKKIKYSCFEDPEVHDLILRMGKEPHNKILDIFLNTSTVILSTFTLIGTTIIFVQVSVWFALGFLLILIPILWFHFKSRDIMETMYNKQTRDERKLNYFAKLLSDKHSLFELKIFNAIHYIIKLWRNSTELVVSQQIKTTFRSQILLFVSTLLLSFFSLFIVLMLAYYMLDGKLSVGLFIALIGSIQTFYIVTDDLARGFSGLSQKYLQIKHFYKFIDLPVVKNIYDDSSKKTSELFHKKEDFIMFKNIEFRYPNATKTVLRDLSFTIKSGERVAIVGKNGAGKSTLIKLLSGLYEPDKGLIVVNGVNINNYSQKQRKNILSAVFQDYSNYFLTLRENVAFGNIKKLEDDIALLEALHKGLAEEVLNLSTLGLNMNLGKLEQDGIDLSKGQWQRVAIARASFSQASFIVLDEPTASLDPVAESTLYKSFLNILKDKGCILISHRLASARFCDRILVMDKGHIVESGTHNKLMDKDGLYAKMFNMQSSWYKDGDSFEN
ncbi:ABC transporter ATP-binding protein [Natronospora cellulosivora (SeqCode)]